MKDITVNELSEKYKVKRLDLKDVELIYTLCIGNSQYYEYCGKEPSVELIESDLQITPPAIPIGQKYYVGFFEEDILVAVMDLIDGYPDSDSIFIGFFMMNQDMQGRGVGSQIISEVLQYLKEKGFKRCQLGIDKDNPQSNHFWMKNEFKVIREVVQEQGTILVAEKKL